MKALSVRQPFATLIATGDKSLEIRSRPTHYRGRLLVVSSAGTDAWQRTYAQSLYGAEAAGAILTRMCGVTICTVDLVGCRPMKRADAALAWVGCDDGAFAWELARPAVVAHVRVKGALGIYDAAVPGDLESHPRHAGNLPSPRARVRGCPACGLACFSRDTVCAVCIAHGTGEASGDEQSEAYGDDLGSHVAAPREAPKAPQASAPRRKPLGFDYDPATDAARLWDESK